MGTMQRRDFVRGCLGIAPLFTGAVRLNASPQFSSDPFPLGVASGDPWPDGVVLWTRPAPDPLNGGGMPPEAVPVEWQVASDEKMRNVVQRGTANSNA